MLKEEVTGLCRQSPKTILEKAVHAAAKENIEASSSADIGMSSSILGTTLVKFMFASVSSEKHIDLGSQVCLLINSNLEDNNIDEVELIKNLEGKELKLVSLSFLSGFFFVQ